MALASRLARTVLFALAVSGYLAASAARVGSVPQQPAAATPPVALDLRATLDTYCIACHNQRLKTAGLMLDTIDAGSPQASSRVSTEISSDKAARSVGVTAGNRGSPKAAARAQYWTAWPSVRSVSGNPTQPRSWCATYTVTNTPLALSNTGRYSGSTT